MQFGLWFEKKKKKMQTGEKKKTILQLQSDCRTTRPWFVDFTTQVGRTLRFPVHSFRVKSIQKEKYQRKFGRKSLLIVCAFNVNPFLFFSLYTRVFIFDGYKLYGSRATALSRSFGFFFFNPQIWSNFQKEKNKGKKKIQENILVCLTFPVRLL